MIESKTNTDVKLNKTDLNTSMHSSESDDLDNFRLRIDNSDADDSSLKDVDMKSSQKEESPIEKDMDVETEKETVNGFEKKSDETSHNGLDKDHVEMPDLVNGICEKMDVDNETDKLTAEELSEESSNKELSEKSSNEELSEKLSTEELSEKSSNEELSEKSSNEELSEKLSTEELSEKLLTEELPEKSSTEELSEKSSTEELSKKSSTEVVEKTGSDEDNRETSESTEEKTDDAKNSVAKENGDKDAILDTNALVNGESEEKVPENNEKAEDRAEPEKTVSSEDNNESPESPTPGNSRPSSLIRSLSGESEPPACDSCIFEQTDEESSNSSNFASDSLKARRRGKKRPLEAEGEIESTGTGAKKIRVEKRHCSDGEQENENVASTSASKKERRRSYSECDLIKDMDSFNSLKQHSTSNGLKNDTWKQPELTAEEKKQLEQANVREKKIRENCLRLIQRNYNNMSVEDLEDSLYVAIMDYFCHYNPSGLLQRKVTMLEKLLSRVQENYNRTFKQFCEAKYLLRRMVEIRKEEAKKCVCKDKLPFKMIRSVAVQVQTARCRGGDLCPGAGAGLDPNFKAGTSSTSKAVPSRKQQSDSQTSVSTDHASSNTTAQSEERPRHITVSVPPTAPVRSAPTLRARPSSELQNGRTLVQRSNNQSRQTVSTVNQASSNNVAKVQPNKIVSKAGPSLTTSVTKSNDSIVIDLTDKDEDLAPPKIAPPPSQKAHQVTVQSPATRVVKTSVLSPMPQLPPLPSAPSYKAIVRRPPQPVLKVCKADQSGIMLSWTLRSQTPNEILFYQVYACQENAGVTREWNTVGDVKALPLPMACTLSQFREGHRYHFVVRAVDKFKVYGEFSHPASILLVTKNGTASPSIATPSNR